MSETQDYSLVGAALYRRMAAHATARAAQMSDAKLRAHYLSAAAQWTSVAEEMENFCATQKLAHA